MKSAVRIVPETSATSVEEEMARIDDGVVRERVERLFRLRGDSVVMRLLEQAVLEFRLEQQR
jgi:hypothetical protein